MSRLKKPSEFPLAVLTDDQRAELDRIERDAFLHFEGAVDELEKAIGMLRLGHHLGWKPLVLIHSKKTVTKYEGILGVKFRDIFPPEGPSAQRSLAFRVASTLSNFWKAVSGETPIPDRQQIGRN